MLLDLLVLLEIALLDCWKHVGNHFLLLELGVLGKIFVNL